MVAQLISNFSPSLVNELRLQWAKEERPRLANVQQVSVTTTIGELGTRTFLPTTQDDKRSQIIDSMSYVTGNHTFKFGGEFSKIKVEQLFGFNQFGNYTFSGLNGTSDILNAYRQRLIRPPANWDVLMCLKPDSINRSAICRQRST